MNFDEMVCRLRAPTRTRFRVIDLNKIGLDNIQYYRISCFRCSPPFCANTNMLDHIKSVITLDKNDLIISYILKNGKIHMFIVNSFNIN